MHPIDEADLPPEIVRVSGLKKVYKSGQTDLVLFENLSFQVRKGRNAGDRGRVGFGKSTLLHILGALDRASAGDVYCAQFPVATLTDDAAADFESMNRLRLAVPLPAAGIYGAGKRGHAAPVQGSAYQTAWRKPRMAARGWTGAGATIVQENFPAVSSNGWLWPGRSYPARDLDGRRANR